MRQDWIVRRVNLVRLRKSLSQRLDEVADDRFRSQIPRHREPLAAFVTGEDLKCLAALRRINPERLALAMGTASRDERIAIARVIGWQETENTEDELGDSWVDASDFEDAYSR